MRAKGGLSMNRNENVDEIIKAAILVDDLMFRIGFNGRPCRQCPRCQLPCPFEMLRESLQKAGIDGYFYASQSTEKNLDRYLGMIQNK
jgi:hypothetical protein